MMLTQKIKTTPAMLYPFRVPPPFCESKAASQISAIEIPIVPKIIGLRRPTRSSRKTMKIRFARGPRQLYMPATSVMRCPLNPSASYRIV